MRFRDAATLEAFDADGRIPLYGFGGERVFALREDGAPSEGLAGAVRDYEDACLRGLPMAASASLAPVVAEASRLASAASPRELHIALVVCDGALAPAARVATSRALAEAAKRAAVAFVLIGVGRGPFAELARLDNDTKHKAFDNLNVVELERVRAECAESGAPLAEALAARALEELPNAVAACRKLRLLP
jgi:hypothetical protein